MNKLQLEMEQKRLEVNITECGNSFSKLKAEEANQYNIARECEDKIRCLEVIISGIQSRLRTEKAKLLEEQA